MNEVVQIFTVNGAMFHRAKNIHTVKHREQRGKYLMSRLILKALNIQLALTSVSCIPIFLTC